MDLIYDPELEVSLQSGDDGCDGSCTGDCEHVIYVGNWAAMGCRKEKFCNAHWTWRR
ncbi:hypothetical protein [Finegoldia magna]|uniref:hypothetical protein n=1 Tax=Finegoldia magna TaxID=1260 RepID=UPI001314F4A6|nr:hypothetical protein [Finegoldia magna]